MIDINKKDEDGLNAFWIAARCGHGDVLRVLALHGIDIYNTDRKGNNALHIAARFQDRFNVLEMLVKSRYDLNRQNSDGDTATHIAAQKGNLRHLSVLIEAKANVDMLNSHSLSPMYLAILNNNTECVKQLLMAGARVYYGDNDRDADRSPVFLAIRNENIEIIRAIFEAVDAEEEAEIRNSQGQTPVMFAAKNNYHKALNALIEVNSTSIN